MGDRESYLSRARTEIDGRVGHIVLSSSIYQTQSWGYNDNDYLNQVIALESEFSPEEILMRTSCIENELGRIRNQEGYQARTIDIDILLYNGVVTNSPTLTIPHPRMQERRFVLIPMCEISENLVHPTLNKTMKELLQSCTDSCNVKLYLKK